MFEKMVLATDLSTDWDRIVVCAEELRVLGCWQAILTHVLVTKGLVGAEVAAESAAQPKMEEQKRQLELQGFDVAVETPIGLPAFSLNEVAQRHCASLIVLGSHGKSAWREALLGSTSSAVLHQARFPILLINVKRLQEGGRTGICQLRTRELLRHVLFPTDFSTVAGDIPPYLEHLASKGLSELTALHALELMDTYPPAILEPAQHAAQGCMNSLVDRLKTSGIPKVHGRIVQGHPTPAILEALKTGEYSMVVMGAQGKSLLSEILLGSVAYNTSRLAPCPVLLIPRRSFQ
jgi:nucleotide-binding universal stress UspA family protein